MTYATLATNTINLKRTRLATQAIFLVCGFWISSWAPMVPFVKDRLHLDDGSIGLLLLFLGAGAIVMMPLTGFLITKIGSCKVIILSAIVMALSLPLLLVMASPVSMAAMLFIFGSGVGSIDVAMNAHGVQVQNLSGKSIMSSLHGLFSVGGLFGALTIGFLIKTGLSPLMAAVIISALLMCIVLTQSRFLMNQNLEKEIEQKFAAEKQIDSSAKNLWLHSKVIFLGFMCFSVFLSEGSMLDWSAIFLRDTRGIEEALSGIGYAAFSIAMAIMRLLGDKVVSKVDGKYIVIYGSLLSLTGYGLIIFSPWVASTLLGFILVGIGVANIVPIFFSEGGRLSEVPSSVAIPAITTMGYAGQLAGPAILGFVAQQTSLSIAFSFTGILLFLVGILYFARPQTPKV